MKIYDKVFILIQPDDFEKPTKVIDIKIIGCDGYSFLYSGKMCEEAKDIIFDLMNENIFFITYNGDLLRDMLNRFFCKDYKNIICLMNLFAVEYGDYNAYFESYTYKKLIFAINYYNKKLGYKEEKNDIDIYDTGDVIINTVRLYNAMKKYEEIRYD